jgi:hypothetical protein
MKLGVVTYQLVKKKFKTTKNRKCYLRKAALKKEDVEKKLKK